MKIWGIIKKHKILTSWLLTFAVVVSVLGVSISPSVPTHLTSVGGQTKYEITIGEQVLAAGLSADYTFTDLNPARSYYANAFDPTGTYDVTATNNLQVI